MHYCSSCLNKKNSWFGLKFLRFLRVVAYRQFTCLVHVQLKDKLIPLPSCAYNAIRSTHELFDDAFTGYDELETDDESERDSLILHIYGSTE